MYYDIQLLTSCHLVSRCLICKHSISHHFSRICWGQIVIMSRTLKFNPVPRLKWKNEISSGQLIDITPLFIWYQTLSKKHQAAIELCSVPVFWLVLTSRSLKVNGNRYQSDDKWRTEHIRCHLWHKFLVNKSSRNDSCLIVKWTQY